MPSELRVFLVPKALINPSPPPVKDGPEVEGAGALAAAALKIFAPKLIEVAIGATAKMLTDAGEAKTLQVRGAAPTHLFIADDQQALALNDELGAIVAVYGNFAEKNDNGGFPDYDAVDVLMKNGLIPQESTVEMILELEVVPSQDRTACFLRTTHCSLNGFFGKDKGERGLSATVTLAKPSASAEGDVFATGAIDLGTVGLPSNLISRQSAAARDAYRSNWLPFAQISTASQAMYDADLTANRAQGQRYMPVMVAVTIAQAEEGHPFLLKLGELLEGAKADTVDAIKKVIIPSEREKDAAERFAAETNLYEEEHTAEDALVQAQNAHEKGTDSEKPMLKRKLDLARRKRDWAVRRRRAAGLPNL